MTNRLPKLPFVPAYLTARGAAYCGNSLELLKALPSQSINLVMTSPPFALQRQKAYGNKDQAEYIDWLLQFGREARRILRDDGSFVLDLGGAYEKGVPTRSLYNFRVLIRFCDELGFFLAEDFYWFNPSKLPSPIEWVNKRKLRAKDAVNTVWWFSKTEWPKANISNVLAPYSDRMKTLLKNPAAFYTPKVRPSGHDIGRASERTMAERFPRICSKFPTANPTANTWTAVEQSEEPSIQRVFRSGCRNSSLTCLLSPATSFSISLRARIRPARPQNQRIVDG